MEMPISSGFLDVLDALITAWLGLATPNGYKQLAHQLREMAVTSEQYAQSGDSGEFGFSLRVRIYTFGC